MLVQSPSLLPSPGPGELAVAANFRIGSTASVDLLGVGVDGRIVLVECGRQEGPGRRPMGGAALAVGAGLWRAPYEEFDRAFAVRAGVPLLDKVAAIARAGGLGWDEGAFRAGVTDNLSAGRFQLILAVDVVSDEVRQVVAYLNAGARPGLAAVALGLRYHAEEGVEILIPTVFRGEGSRDDISSDSGRGGAPAEVSLPAQSDTPEPAGVQATSLPSRPAPAPAPATAPSGVASGPAPRAAAPPSPVAAAPLNTPTASTAPPAPSPAADPAPGRAPVSGSSSPFARPADQEAEAPATSSDPALSGGPDAPATDSPATGARDAGAPTPEPVPAPGPAAETTPAPAPAATRAARPTAAAGPAVGQGEHALFAALEGSCLPAAVDAVRRLYHIARDRGRELQWGHGEHPAVTAVYDVDGKAVGLWSCYTDLKPSFVVNFEWLAPHVPIERLQRLADRLAELPSVPERLAGLAEAGYKRRLALAVNAVLAQPGAADVISSAFNELLDPDAAKAGATATSVPPPPPTAVAGNRSNKPS
ncbi:MAG TPA: hypothetical protein VGR20_19100 [Acidimicrobiia bacterium]|nr:hypothetical protein [Acidimicrobiia bacterium]